MEQQQRQVRAIVRNIGQLVSVAQAPIAGASGPLQVLTNTAIIVDDEGNISWIGPDQDVDEQLASSEPQQVNIVDAYGCVITPGFVDSHTHLVFAGDRAEEFHLRRQGISYGELLRQGRGILTTMNATRNASSEVLLDLAVERLAAVRAHGTTTVEIKTGYGLNVEAEERCLRIINDLNSSPSLPHEHIRVVPTFLGAHSVPPEYRTQRAAYVDLVVEEMLPTFAEMARFCDVYCEREAFSVAECRRILTRAKELGYQLKVHADQLSPSGGSQLAAELGAVSADHLDYASDADLDAMRAAGVIATLLPGCSYTLRSPYPSARRLRDHGLTVALATDYNPGTSYSENMQMMLGLAMSAMGMSLEEALSAATINGARALALQDQIGSLEIGKRCELALWSIHDYHEIGYHFGTNLVQSILVL
ncbi:imidazolonepropionase [Dictyobacter formicarum]|uniref:Imidazolonepropionase n=1 Tax=Dictyobacter formicarum TaxID=2778368 RepID=A0ABQ3VFM7_9CHLR|nr:imidazolonepropionase [Dictyobacter formicarum]GHO84972.1 imidazolonepropionase [Dictyobacter formicarum]